MGEEAKNSLSMKVEDAGIECKENQTENIESKPKRKSHKKKKKKDLQHQEILTDKVLQRATDIIEMLKD